MPGEQRLGAQCRHAVERICPVADVALDLLRVSRIRYGIDEQIPGSENPALGDPGPRVVVRLSASMVQTECEGAALEGQAIPVHHVGVAVALRKPELGCIDRELPPVDRGVPTERAEIAIDVVRHQLVRVHGGRGPSLLGGLSVEARRGEDVVHVMV